MHIQYKETVELQNLKIKELSKGFSTQYQLWGLLYHWGEVIPRSRGRTAWALCSLLQRALGRIISHMWRRPWVKSSGVEGGCVDCGFVLTHVHRYVAKPEKSSLFSTLALHPYSQNGSFHKFSMSRCAEVFIRIKGPFKNTHKILLTCERLCSNFVDWCLLSCSVMKPTLGRTRK